MRKREKEILRYVIENERVSLNEMILEFGVSRRTLYYALSEINDFIKKAGTIQLIQKKYRFIGNMTVLKSLLGEESAFTEYLEYEKRKEYILRKIFMNEKVTIDQMAGEMLVSKNTVVLTFNKMKKDLKALNLGMQYKRKYMIIGEEEAVRKLFLVTLHSEKFYPVDNHQLNDFEKKYGLNLTDASLSQLSLFIDFIKIRVNTRHALSAYKFTEEAKKLPYYEAIKDIVHFKLNEYEQAYITTYISSLSSLNQEVNEEKIRHMADKIISQFEYRISVPIEDKDKIRKNLVRHLSSSYNRIKFRFPVNNPMLLEIKSKYKNIFLITKSIIENMSNFPELIGISEEEVAFIAIYFGAYLKSQEKRLQYQGNQVLIVCHNGLTISKSLEMQIYRHLPFIDVVASIPIKDIKGFDEKYDHIISTVELKEFENVIVVNPILTKYDIGSIMERVFMYSPHIERINIQDIMRLIRNHADITDEDKLRKEIENVLYHLDKSETEKPELKDLITKDKIQIVERVKNWKEAIGMAARPIIKDKSITNQYVKAMIDTIEEKGPYVVLADRFALPHASVEDGVRRLSMSMLIIKEPVDLRGKLVNIMMVLAPIDNSLHLKALGSLFELFSDEKHIRAIIESSTIEHILKLVRKE